MILFASASYPLTVGKLYAGMLIMKKWKKYKTWKSPYKEERLSRTSSQYYFPCYNDYRSIVPIGNSNEIQYSDDVFSGEDFDLQGIKELDEISVESLVIVNSIHDELDAPRRPGLFPNIVSEIFGRIQQMITDSKDKLIGSNDV